MCFIVIGMKQSVSKDIFISGVQSNNGRPFWGFGISGSLYYYYKIDRAYLFHCDHILHYREYCSHTNLKGNQFAYLSSLSRFP